MIIPAVLVILILFFAFFYFYGVDYLFNRSEFKELEELEKKLF